MDAIDKCVDRIFEILECHRFAETMVAELRIFWDTMDIPNMQQPKSSWCTLRVFCTIGVQLVRLRKMRAVQWLNDYNLVVGVLRLLPAVYVARSISAVQMLSEICRFVASAIYWDIEPLESLTQCEPQVLATLISSLEPSFYAGFPEDLRARTIAGLCHLFIPLSQQGLCAIRGPENCRENVKTLLRLAKFALESPTTDQLAGPVLIILQNFIQSPPDDPSEGTFGDMLDVIMIEDDGDDDNANTELAATMFFRILYAFLKKSKSLY